MKKLLLFIFILPFAGSCLAFADFSTVVKKIKPAIVGVGTFTPNGRPQNVLSGTGFVIGNGRYVVTNYHVVPNDGTLEDNQTRVIFAGQGKDGKAYQAKTIAYSQEHDLAILEHSGPLLPAFSLANNSLISEGTAIAFTGFPIGAILGLYSVTHRGYIASVTPVVIPASASSQLTAAAVKRLKDPYMVYQLDATAYPGNSGSPVYNINKGEVIAVINKVFIQQTKEAAITNPSGITYAIPVKFVHELIKQSKVNIDK